MSVREWLIRAFQIASDHLGDIVERCRPNYLGDAPILTSPPDHPIIPAIGTQLLREVQMSAGFTGFFGIDEKNRHAGLAYLQGRGAAIAEILHILDGVLDSDSAIRIFRTRSIGSWLSATFRWPARHRRPGQTEPSGRRSRLALARDPLSRQSVRDRDGSAVPLSSLRSLPGRASPRESVTLSILSPMGRSFKARPLVLQWQRC